MSKKPWERRGRMSAKEFVALLEADPEYQAAIAKQEREAAEHAARVHAEERPIIEDLRKAGFRVKTLHDLINMYGAGLPWERLKPTRPYVEALPILFKHLQRPYSASVRGTIAQVMISKAARPYWDTVKTLLYAEKDDFTQQMLFNVLGAIAVHDKHLLPETISMIRDRKLGPNRSLLVSVLTHYASRIPEAERALQELKNEPDLKVEIGHRLHQRELRQRRKARKGTPKR